MKKQNIIFWMLAAMLLPLAAGAQCNITLPYSENFNSYSTGGATFPTCWTRVDSAISGNAVYPNVFSSGGNYGNVLNFNGNSTSTTGVMRAATPRIPSPLNSLELSFAVYKNTLKVYAATNPADQTTYHLIGSYAPGYSWTTYEVRTDTVSGMPSDTGYLVFAANHGTGYGNDNPYLDNLTIVALNSCARPDQVTVEQLTNTTATLSWTEVTGAQGYRVFYDTVDEIMYADELPASSTGITLSDLLPNHHYYVWVQTVCAPGTYSDSRTADFTTQLNCYPPVNLRQVSAGFDAASFAWEYDDRGISATGMWTVLRDLDDSTATVEEQSAGDMSHFVSGLNPEHSYEVDFYTLCGGDTAAVATLPVVFKVCGESQLANQTHDYDMHPVPVGYNYGYAQMMYPSDVFLDMDTIRGIALHRYTQGNGASVTRTLSIWMHNTTDTVHNSVVPTTGMTQVANDTSYTFPVQEWDTIYFSTPFVYTPGSNVILTIDDNTGSHVSTGAAQWMWHEQMWKTLYKHSDDNNINPASVTGLTNTQRCPDMHFVGNCNTDLSCVAPVVAVSEVDSFNVVIVWAESGAENYIVEYRTTGSVAWIQADTVQATTYTLNNLQSATHYEVRLGVLCNDEMRYSDIVSFSTGCALQHLPFHFTQNDMCAAADNGLSNCWDHSQYIYRGRLTDSHRGYLRNAGNGEWIMLPTIAEPLQDARLRMWVGSSDQGFVKVGIASMPNASDVEWIDTIEIPASNPNTSHDEYVSYLDNYTGTGNRIVLSPIVNNNYHFIYFFDFHVEVIEDCRPVSNLVLDSSSATTLSVSWTPRSESSQWAVYVNGTQRTVVSGQPHHTFTGLSPYTMYEVSVRSLCDEDSSSLISAQYRTACSGEQCTFTIDAHASTGEGWMGAHLLIYAGGEQIDNFTMLRDSNLSRSYNVCADMPVLFKWTYGNDDAVCSFELRNASGDILYALAEGPGRIDTLFTTNNPCSDDPGTGCLDRYSSVSETACDSYQWQGLTLTASGNYSDTVAGAVEGGCDSIYILHLTVNQSVSQTIDTTVVDSLVWHGTTYTESGTYSWTGTAINGCDSIETLILTIGGTQGIEALEDVPMALYPNPTTGMVKIVADGIETIEVYDAMGRQLLKVRSSDVVDLSGLAAGTYTLRVTLSKGTVMRRVMKY